MIFEEIFDQNCLIVSEISTKFYIMLNGCSIKLYLDKLKGKYVTMDYITDVGFNRFMKKYNVRALQRK